MAYAIAIAEDRSKPTALDDHLAELFAQGADLIIEIFFSGKAARLVFIGKDPVERPDPVPKIAGADFFEKPH
jgi:hypothetical protein